MNINTAGFGPLNEKHITHIQETLDKSLEEHPRILLLRVDLHLPDEGHADSAVITRFIVSLKEQIKSDLHRKKRLAKGHFHVISGISGCVNLARRERNIIMLPC